MALEIADNAALMIIDFQNAIDDPSWGRRNNPDAEAQAGRLLNAWRRSRRPVIHVQHLSQRPDSPYRLGQAGCEFKQPLVPGPGEIVIQKRTSNAFIETGLQAALRDRSVTDLIVVGVLLHNSVDATVRMAGNLGYRTWLAEDATVSVDLRDLEGCLWPAEDVHAVSLAQLNREYARVVTTGAVMASIHSLVARHPPA